MSSKKMSCISSVAMVYASVILIYLVSRSDCFRWVKGTYPSTKFANRSGPALFRWKYEVGGSAPGNLKIECGYLQTVGDVQNLVVLAAKVGHSKPMTHRKDLPRVGSYTTIEAYNEHLSGGGLDKSVVGFRIVQSELYQPKVYRCTAVSSDAGQLNFKQSEAKELVVLDPPKLVECLQDLQPVKEDADLRISCSASGSPPPSLECRLITYHGETLDRIPKDGPKVENISSQVFVKVSRRAEEVMCLATADHTGHVNLTMVLDVRHTPFNPDMVKFVPAYNKSSLNVKWSQILNNETGGEILGYRITYYKTNEKITAKTKNLPIATLTLDAEGFYSYQITGLESSVSYTVEVFGYNQYGDGHHTKKEQIPSLIPSYSKQEEDTDVGIIIGGIIAGIVFIVIFVILAVWCSSRSKKHEKFPASHVEDAVDYPANVGPTLYASVEKKKKPHPQTDSLNEYPDVVTDTEMRPFVTNTYEPSNKSFV